MGEIYFVPSLFAVASLAASMQPRLWCRLIIVVFRDLLLLACMLACSCASEGHLNIVEFFVIFCVASLSASTQSRL